jgi:hypothetical protein
MKEALKRVIKQTPLYPAVRQWLFVQRQAGAVAEWERRGRPAPLPHIIKQQTLQELAARFNLKVLVKMGTYYGDMVAAMRPFFDRIYSIELSRDLYEKAARRFANDGAVQIIYGDIGVEFGNLVPWLEGPALFWLDGHYAAGETALGGKDTPIFEELAHIFNSGSAGHVIVIANARSFGRDAGYPTIAELKQFIRSAKPDAYIEVENDSILVLPREADRS